MTLRLMPAVALLALTVPVAAQRAADDTSDPAVESDAPVATRPGSPRPLGKRLGERLGRQDSSSPTPVGHRRRLRPPERPILPTRPLVDADAPR